MFCNRTIALPAIFIGALVNVYALYHVLALWSRVTNEGESEWEGAGANSVRSLGVILVTYLIFAAAAYLVGFIGVLKRIPSWVRIFLQFSFADFVLYALTLVIVAFAGYRPSEWRETVCEELSTQPDILRSLSEAGFNLESCESWIENLVIGVVVLLSVGLVLKLQFTIAVSTYYTSLARATGHPPSVFARTPRPSPVRRQSVTARSRHQSTPINRINTSDLPPYSDSMDMPTVIVSSPGDDADKDVLVMSDLGDEAGSTSFNGGRYDEPEGRGDSKRRV